LTLWQCVTKVILAFFVFALLVLRVINCRPYTPFQPLGFSIYYYSRSQMSVILNFMVPRKGSLKNRCITSLQKLCIAP